MTKNAKQKLESEIHHLKDKHINLKSRIKELIESKERAVKSQLNL